MGVSEGEKGGAFSQVSDTAELARAMVRAALKGALATVHKGSGHPYASLVLSATDRDGAPILLISRLALHTQNLQADARASLLIDATGTDADPQQDPMAGARVTVIGTCRPTDSQSVRDRFLARHPAAAGYADFADFGFFRLAPERAHYIGGFGKIVDLDAADLLVGLEGAEDLAAGEAGIVAHMNDDHADAIELYATKLLGAAPGGWRMTGIDPEGCDLVSGARGLRLAFGTRITNASEARHELVRLVGVARGS